MVHYIFSAPERLFDMGREMEGPFEESKPKTFVCAKCGESIPTGRALYFMMDSTFCSQSCRMSLLRGEDRRGECKKGVCRGKHENLKRERSLGEAAVKAGRHFLEYLTTR